MYTRIVDANAPNSADIAGLLFAVQFKHSLHPIPPLPPNKHIPNPTRLIPNHQPQPLPKPRLPLLPQNRKIPREKCPIVAWHIAHQRSMHDHAVMVHFVREHTESKGTCVGEIVLAEESPVGIGGIVEFPVLEVSGAVGGEGGR